ncbi:MAG: peptide deformylase [Bifidobacteriaceae bacterium]|jgi:peptide deformylase|nr:peptide deformylase [Bifidobacteriaceae bacterium]
MIREIRILPDPVLRTKCAVIERITPDIETLVADLLENVDDPGRAGLAANQIGISLRAFSYNIDSVLGYILNPVLVELSDEMQDGEEGCLSVPDFYFPLDRANYARSEGINLKGEKVVLEGEGLMARCIQHECGHLEGKLYIDSLTKAVRKRALPEISKKLNLY